LSLSRSIVLIENYSLTGFHFAKDPNVNTYVVYTYLPHEAYYKNTIRTMIAQHLIQMLNDGLHTSPADIEALRVSEK